MFDPDEIIDSNEPVESEFQDTDLDALGDSDDISLQIADMLGDESADLGEGHMLEDIDGIDTQGSLEADAANSGIVLGLPEGELLSSIRLQDYEPSLDSDPIQTEPTIDPLDSENVLSSIVKVSTDSGSWGSGVFLSPDSIPELAEKLQGDKLILTADHVALHDSDGLVEVSIGPSGETVIAEVIRPNIDSSDLAFLRVRASNLGDANITELSLAASVEEGEPVFQAGFPESAPGMVIDSGAVTHRGSVSSWLGHSAESEPGDSGGPIINGNGEVVGISSGEGEFRSITSVREMAMGMNHQHIEEVIRIALKRGLF